MASYPGTIATFSTKVDGVTTVIAADPNLIQDEVLAIENILGTNPNQSTLSSVGTYNASPTTTTFGSVTARIANIEAGLVTSINTGTTNASNTTALTTRVSTAETNITSLTNRMTAAETVNTTQTSNISTNTTNISSLTTRMTAAETTLAGVATDTNLSALTTRVTNVETVNTTQTTNITNATNSISTINTTLTGYTTSITTGALITSAASTTAPIGLKINQSTNANSKRASIELGSGWLIGQDSSTSTSGGLKDFFIYDATTSAFRLKIGTDGIISTISSLKLRPGTVAAGTAPLYFDTVSPALLTSPVAGAMEYDGTNLYFTPSGVTRKTIAYVDATPTGITTINGITVSGSSGTFLTTTSTTSALTTLGTLGRLVIAASNGTNPPIKLTAGTSISSGGNMNGALEYDGTVAYFRPNDTINGQALLPSTFYWVNSASRTLSTASPASTVAQWIYGGATGTGVGADNRGLGLAGSTTYEFELVGNLLLTTTTAMDVALKLTYSGTHSLMAIHAIHGTNQSTPNFTWLQATSGDISLTLGSVNTATGRLNFTVKGIIRVTSGGGIFAPKVLLSANNSSGSMSVGAGSYIKITPLGNESVNALGYWQ